MKERIVITDSQAIDEWNRTIACYVDTDNSIYKAKFEKVPETWEELKELCKGITLDLKVCKDGTIYCYEYCLAKNRTIEQMWQIIKSLIGEE